MEDCRREGKEKGGIVLRNVYEVGEGEVRCVRLFIGRVSMGDRQRALWILETVFVVVIFFVTFTVKGWEDQDF